MLKSLAAIIIAFLLLLGSPFDYPAYAQQQKPTSVTIVGDRGFRPFHFTSRGQCVGILVDLWALWSRKTDIKTTFSCDLDWSAALDEVRKGRADIVGGVIRSTDREVWLDFAGNVITTYFYVYFHPSLGAFKDIDTLPDTTPIGVVKDDYPEGVLRAKYPTHSVRAYDDHDALISAAIRKDVLAFVLEPEVADYYFAIKGQIPAPFKRASEPFSIEKLDAGVRKERRDVSYWVKVGLGRITAGERAAILRRWNYSSSTHRFQSVVDAISRHAYVAIGVCVFLAYCVLLAAVWLFSELLPVRCLAFERLLRESLRFSLTLGATKFELSLRGVLLLQMFTYRSHVVDRWLATVTQRAQANFQRITATISGTSYTPLPLILDGELLTADDSAILEREVRSKIRTAVVVSRAPVVLFGEGGAGKTSTALRFAEWVCGFGEQSALGWPILPVLIEEDLEFQDKDTDRAILLAVQGRLTALTEEPVDGEMTAYLLRERRVCVVLDGLSERSDRTRRVFQARQANYPLVLLIATSRFEQDECFAGVPVRSVQPTRIGGVHISTFLNRYLIDLKKRVLFSDSEFYEVCGRIALFTGNRDITPLFAKLFADLEVSRRETSMDTAGIHSVAALVESYVVGLNRQIKEGRLSDHKVLDLAKSISWIEIAPSLSPRVMLRAEMAKSAGDEEFTDSIQEYFERKLLFIRRVDNTGERLRVSLDPVAEHLAASRVLALALGGKPHDLEEILKYADLASREELEKRSGFLIALWDAWEPIRPDVRLRNDRLARAAEKVGSFVTATRESSLRRNSAEGGVL